MRTILNILLVLLIVSTVSICFTKPDMHKTVFVYNSDYTIVPEKRTETYTETIPIMEQPVKPKVETIKVETVTVPQTNTIKSQQVKTNKIVNQTKKQTVKSKTDTPVKTVVTKETKPVSTKPVETVKKQTTVTKPIQAEKKQIVQVEQKPIIKQEQTPVTKKVLTQQEENIAWNVWRSNLQNKIMQDTKLPYIPNGVVFKFSFTVDEYGRISNLQTWSENQGFTPYAIQYIAPVIRSYQGRSILNFPEGTARKSTEVKGGWKISDNEKYSNPNDYNDIERVKKI